MGNFLCVLYCLHYSSPLYPSVDTRWVHAYIKDVVARLSWKVEKKIATLVILTKGNVSLIWYTPKTHNFFFFETLYLSNQITLYDFYKQNVPIHIWHCDKRCSNGNTPHFWSPRSIMYKIEVKNASKCFQIRILKTEIPQLFTIDMKSDEKFTCFYYSDLDMKYLTFAHDK